MSTSNVSATSDTFAIGRFAVEARIGAGGMGVVYRARDPETGQRVAIKVLERNSSDERARFRREARVMSRIDHPNVVHYHDHGTTEDDRDYLVMDWLSGRDLNDHLLLVGPLAVADALRLTAAAAEGLAAVHDLGVVHRDVKPGNLFLVDHDVADVRVMDFGIARATDGATPLTTTGAIIGTPLYMSPEQLRAAVEQRSDVYGLGATLFHCLAGRPPFIGEHPGAVVVAILSQPVPHLATFRADVPEVVDAFIGRMLAKDPRDRPADMRAVVTEVAALLTDSSPRQRRSVMSRIERGVAVATTGEHALASLPAVTSAPDDEPSRTEVAPALAPVFAVDMRLDLVGRARPLAELVGVMDESREEVLAREVVITGATGVGKSRIVESGLVIGATRGWRCLSASGNRERATRPFSVLTRLLAGVVAATDFVASLARLGSGWSRGPGARVDPLVEADRLALAWLDLLDVLSAQGPLLLAVDDAHLSDLASLRYVDRALEHLAERTLVVIKALPDDARVPPVDLATRVTIALGPLRRGALDRLAERWASGHSSSARSAIAQKCEGDLGYLRELARRLDDGALPITGATRADAARVRLDRLGPEERHVLRAASIVGDEVLVSAVAHLLGLAERDAGLTRRLRTLVAEGFLRPLGATQTSFEFSDGAVQSAVYASCTPEDLVAGHTAMGAWLLASPGHAPIAVARHLESAGDPVHAARYFLLAARAALAAGDAASFDDCLGRAKVGAVETLGEASLLEARGAFWRAALKEARDAAANALEHLARGSDAWFQAASLALTAAGQVGDHAAVRRFTSEALSTQPIDVSSEDQRIVALCRAVTQVGTFDEEALQLYASVSGIDPTSRSAEAQAWLHHARARRHLREFDIVIDAFTQSHRAHAEAGDVRASGLMGVLLATAYTWSGAWERARTAVDDALVVVQRLGASYLVTWARYTAAKALVETAPLAEACAALDAVVVATTQSPRMQAGALVYAAIAALRAGAIDLAQDYAVRAGQAHTSADTVAASVALRSRCRVAHDVAAAPAEVVETLRCELTVAVARSNVVEFDELVRLAHAELLWALGESSAARAAIDAAAHIIDERASTLADPISRNNYYARPHIVATTLRLRREWAIASS